MRFWHPLAAVACLTPLLGGLAPVGAQVVRGRLVEAETSRPVPGALVHLIGEHDSTVLARGASSDLGRFELRAPEAGAYRIQVFRIGHERWTSPPLGLDARDTGERLFRIPALPITLAEISVTAQSPCRELTRQEGTATLWEEARKAFALAEQTLSGGELEFDVRVTRRRRDPKGGLEMELGSRTRGRGEWPVRSIAPESLATNGYVQPRDTVSGPVYFGPDARVLFSDAFLQTHCFQLASDSATGRGWIGLSFSPVKERDVPDIEGVLWLDRRTAELQRLEYRYTGLWKWVPADGAFGELEFLRVAGGRWIVRRWMLRAPVAATQPWPFGARRRTDEDEVRFFGGGRISLHGFQEEEGQVLQVKLPDGTSLWKAS